MHTIDVVERYPMGKEMTYHKDCDRSDINIKHFYLKSLEYAALYTKLFTDLVIKMEVVNARSVSCFWIFFIYTLENFYATVHSMNHTLVPYRFEGAENKHHFTDLYPISKTGQEKSLSLEPASILSLL